MNYSCRMVLLCGAAVDCRLPSYGKPLIIATLWEGQVAYLSAQYVRS